MATNGLNYASSGLTFTTNSVKREIIDTSGNHGFGTLSPTTLVHISGSSTPVRIEGLGSGTDGRILASNTNGVLSYRDDVLVGGSILDNTITLTDSDGTTAALTVQAVTGVTYAGNWDLGLEGSGTIGATPVALPFITGGAYASGTITLTVNGPTADIIINGIDGDDTFVTGGTFSNGTAAFTRNDGNSFNVTGFWTSIPNSALVNDNVTIGSTSVDLGATAATLAGLTSVTSTSFVGELTGNASTASKWASTMALTLGTDLSGNVSFDGSAGVTLNAEIVAGAVGTTELATGAVTTAKITDGNVTNAKLADSDITFVPTAGSNNVVSLGNSLTFTSSNGSVVVTGDGTGGLDLTVGAGVDTYSTGGTFSNGTLTIGLNDGSDFDVTGLWTSIPNAALANSTVTVGSTSIALGATSTTLAGLTSVTSTSFVGELTGNASSASTADKWDAAMTLTLGTDLSGNVSFDGSAGVTLNASIVAGSVDTTELADNAVTTAKILNGNVTNAKLANSSISVSDGTTSSSIALGGSFTIAGGTGIDSSNSSGTVTLSIDNTVVTTTGSQTLTNKVINGSQLVDGSVSNAKLAASAFTIAGDSGVDQTISLGDTLTLSGSSGIDFVGVSTDELHAVLDSSVLQFKSEKAQANGYASLDANGKIPTSQLPSSAFEYKGAWNAATNTPTLANGTGDAGDTYRVSVAGTQLGQTWNVGDLALYDGSVWQKVDGADAVESVNGQTGVVVLDTDDIQELGGATNKWDKTVVLTSGTGISATGTYPNFTITNSDLGSSQNIFKTVSVPTGTNPAAAANNDTLAFISSDSTVSISGNSSSNTIDIKVDTSNVTNIYGADGTLSGNRTVTQAGNSLTFTGGDFSVDGVLFYDDSAGAVGIGTVAPDASAILEVSSTSQGFLFPRMSEAQRGAITSPATGLLVYQTDGDEGIYIKKSFGWVQVI
jgi:hypothetical protein